MTSDAAWFATNKNYQHLLKPFDPGAVGQGNGSPDFDRRCLLLAIACARRVLDRIRLPACRDALVIAERAACLFRVDPDSATQLLRETYDYRLAVARYHSQDVNHYQKAVGCKSWDRVAMYALHPCPAMGFYMASQLLTVLFARGDREEARRQQQITCEMVRDVFEPPSKMGQAIVGPSSAKAIEAAVAMNRTGDYTGMPALGELLSNCGCRDPAVLDHCFLHNRHIQGCWVVDQLLSAAIA
jgi:hypothetical protein